MLTTKYIMCKVLPGNSIYYEQITLIKKKKKY